MATLRICLISFLACLFAALASCVEIPSDKKLFYQSRVPQISDTEMAERLYELARKENQALHWDGCLATAASERAKQLADDGYFDSNDPKTGKNPVWRMVSKCLPDESKASKVPAGENLSKVKKIDTPEKIHKAFMESPNRLLKKGGLHN
ncbi:MAG: hypothetical protein ACLQVJ_12490 [Syntrophobacteraceae bacterium]